VGKKSLLMTLNYKNLSPRSINVLHWSTFARAMGASGWLLVGPLAAGQAGCSSGTPQPPSIQTSVSDAADPHFASLLSFLQGEMTANQVPGAAIAVVLNWSLAFQAGVGV
jgi:CubicO group peptidase (beta-lactamase class C family)